MAEQYQYNNLHELVPRTEHLGGSGRKAKNLPCSHIGYHITFSSSLLLCGRMWGEKLGPLH